MKLHTKDSLAKYVVRQWAEPRGAYYWHKRNGSEDADKMARCIEALKNGTLDAEMINEEFGKENYWIRSECFECKRDSQALVEIGKVSTIDSKTALVCLSCLKKAVVEVITCMAGLV